MGSDNAQTPTPQTPHVVGAGFAPSVVITLHVIDKIFTTLWLVIKTMMWLGIAYYAYLSIKELAGQKTEAEFILKYLTEEGEHSSPALPWMLLSGTAVIWAIFERKLRLQKVSSMSDRVKKLESAIDSKRTSSGLTKAGETPEEEANP